MVVFSCTEEIRNLFREQVVHEQFSCCLVDGFQDFAGISIGNWRKEFWNLFSWIVYTREKFKKLLLDRL